MLDSFLDMLDDPLTQSKDKKSFSELTPIHDISLQDKSLQKNKSSQQRRSKIQKSMKASSRKSQAQVARASVIQPAFSSIVSTILGIVLTVFLVNLGFAQNPEESQSGISVGIIVMFVMMFVLSAFFSSAETAFTALGKWKIRELYEGGKTFYGHLEKDLTRFITTCLIGNNLANIAATALITRVSVDLAEAWSFNESLMLTYTTSLMTILVLILGEITPKSLAVHHPEAVADIAIHPIYALSQILYPLGLALTYISTSILRLLNLEPRDQNIVTETELHLMLQSAEESGTIERQESDMIRGVIELEDTIAREVMTPRVDIIALSEDATLEQMLEKTKEFGYSRLPIYRERIDSVQGIVYARDLLNYLETNHSLTDFQVADIMHTPQYVPETMTLLRLLKEMRLRKNHIAIVLDEFGGTAGIVTLEDIIEEITGEIYDETDEDEDADISLLEKGHYRISGSTDIDDVGKRLNIEFDPQADYNTLAGFMIDEFDRIPSENESLLFEGYQFTIEIIDERRITSIIALYVGEESEEQTGEESEDIVKGNSDDYVTVDELASDSR